MMGRFSRLRDEDFVDIQQRVDRRVALIERLASGGSI